MVRNFSGGMDLYSQDFYVKFFFILQIFQKFSFKIQWFGQVQELDFYENFLVIFVEGMSFGYLGYLYDLYVYFLYTLRLGMVFL